MRKALAILIIVAGFFDHQAHAQTGLVQICTDSSQAGNPAQSCINSLSWNVPQPTSLVLVRPQGSTSEWADDTIWTPLSSAVPPEQIRTCGDPLTPPAIHGGVGNPPVYVPDPCTNHVWITAPQGSNVLVTCTPPTTNTNNTPISQTQQPLKFYFWEALQSGIQTGIYRQISPAQPQCQYNWPNLEVGMHYFVVATADALGGLSGPSNEATKNVLPPGQPIPAAPTSLSAPLKVTTDPRIFVMKQTKNQITFTQVGTKPLSSTCDDTQPVLDKFVVPREGVTWLGSVQPQVVFGICQ
jgi:hypothetical protein